MPKHKPNRNTKSGARKIRAKNKLRHDRKMERRRSSMSTLSERSSVRIEDADDWFVLKSGHKFARFGTNILLDASDVNPEGVAEFKETFRQQAIELPRILNEQERDVRARIMKLPTLPTLASLALITFVMDPNEYRETEAAFPALAVEWPTRVSLELPKPNATKGFDSPQNVIDFSNELNQLVGALDRLFETFRNTVHSDRIRRDASFTAMDDLRFAAKVNSMFVRNSMYEFQVFSMLKALFEPFGEELRRIIGFTILDLIEFYNVINKQLSDRVISMFILYGKEQGDLAQSLKINTKKPVKWIDCVGCHRCTYSRWNRLVYLHSRLMTLMIQVLHQAY